MRPVFIFGASGHAKVVIDILELVGNLVVEFLVDDNRDLWGEQFFGYTVIGGREALLAKEMNLECNGIVAIGSNQTRKRVASWLAGHGYQLASTVHPSACLGRGVRLGAGTVLMAGAVINSDTLIGDNVIVNTGATVDHDCRVMDSVHVAPGVHVCGGVTIGSGTLVGAGSTIAPGIAVGKDVVVGAGATVVSSVADGVIVMGTPAKAKELEWPKK